MRAVLVMGTRPEAIKLWPVVTELRRHGAEAILCDTGQQRDLLAQTLPALGFAPHIRLGLMTPGLRPQALAEIMADRLIGVLEHHRPDWVVVQGDTTSALAGATAARTVGISLAHVEAGLRTFDLTAPWPEEHNRIEIARLADRHFAPTPGAADNLRAEGAIEATIEVTGNTGVDALHAMLARLEADRTLRLAAEAEISAIAACRRLIVVTAHRRENFSSLDDLASALVELAQRDDAQIVVTSHPNPATGPFTERVAAERRIQVSPPLSYPAFLLLMRRATLLVTDSGGLQEEAPSLGLPVLVTRVSTERQEALDAGAAELVSPRDLNAAVCRLLDDPAPYAAMAQIRSPFGDGRAAERIAKTLLTPTSAFQVEAC